MTELRLKNSRWLLWQKDLEAANMTWGGAAGPGQQEGTIRVGGRAFVGREMEEEEEDHQGGREAGWVREDQGC